MACQSYQDRSEYPRQVPASKLGITGTVSYRGLFVHMAVTPQLQEDRSRGVKRMPGQRDGQPAGPVIGAWTSKGPPHGTQPLAFS